MCELGVIEPGNRAQYGPHCSYSVFGTTKPGRGLRVFMTPSKEQDQAIAQAGRHQVTEWIAVCRWCPFEVAIIRMSEKGG